MDDRCAEVQMVAIMSLLFLLTLNGAQKKQQNICLQALPERCRRGPYGNSGNNTSRLTSEDRNAIAIS